MTGHFSEESLEMYSELVASGSATYDFTRCLRSDGSAYGTGGKCKKGVETSALDVLQSGIKGRVPKDDPKEPLASGSTPLEKAKDKLKTFEKKISDPNKTPTERELEQYGKLKMAVEQFENKKEKTGLFGREDRSDIDQSKTRELGKERRKVLPRSEDRQTLVKAREIHRKYLRDKDPILKRRSKATTEEILKLESDHKEIKETKEELKGLIERLPKKVDFMVRSRMENILTTLTKAESSYSKALDRLTKAS